MADSVLQHLCRIPAPIHGRLRSVSSLFALVDEQEFLISSWRRRACIFLELYIMFSARRLFAALVAGAAAQDADGLSREQLKLLTSFRQQHRRTVCDWDLQCRYRGGVMFRRCSSLAGGWPTLRCRVRAGQACLHWLRRCARLSLGSCVVKRVSGSGVGRDKFLWQRHAARKAPSPKGGSGREWCYVEAQVAVMGLEFCNDAVARKLAVPGSWSLPG